MQKEKKSQASTEHRSELIEVLWFTVIWLKKIHQNLTER